MPRRCLVLRCTTAASFCSQEASRWPPGPSPSPRAAHGPRPRGPHPERLRVSAAHRATGWLLANEAMRTTAFAQLVFGSTEGWWSFAAAADPARRRQDSPLLHVEQWGELLATSGFGWRHSMLGVETPQGLLVAQAAAPTAGGMRSPAHDPRGASHFITGGLGGLGLLAARLLVQRGGQTVLLASRSGRVMRGSEADWDGLVRSLPGCRGQLLQLRFDASHASSVQAGWRALQSTGTVAAGVLHTAHQLADATLPNQMASRFALAYGAKVGGAQLLHCAAAGSLLRAFSL